LQEAIKAKKLAVTKQEKKMQCFIFFTCLAIFVMASPAFAQQMEDVVYLKNGGLIRGTIIEQVPGESLKIQTRDGNVFVYTMGEVAKILKEPVTRMRGQVGVQEKNPVVSCILSILVPGVGQFYNGEPRKGIANLVVAIGGAVLYEYGAQDVTGGDGFFYQVRPRNESLALTGAVAWFSTYVWSIIDAPISANRINKQNQQASYGHLIELGGSRSTLGVDPVVSRKNMGTRLTLHF